MQECLLKIKLMGIIPANEKWDMRYAFSRLSFFPASRAMKGVCLLFKGITGVAGRALMW